ncbi:MULTISPECIES: hypothetical protein [Actinosynnema]|uniref:hypothetical protein n=1 Tax=Actinosynnema TaxID=40566 RepID=UPI0020A30EF8|nr:hypothetical protein [Actinosynnema pretiosum]MCP2098190.1 hypothetical protein [Actinosynnema pretiosum]
MTTTEPFTPDEREQSARGVWGAEQAGGEPLPRVRRGLVAGAIALAVAVGGGVVYATSGSSDSSSSAIGQAPGGSAGGFGGAGGAGGGMGGGVVADAVHGEYVVSDGEGGYATQVVQTGTITAISGTSVTAASSDGYTRTYVIDAETVFGAMTGPGGGQGGPGGSAGSDGSAGTAGPAGSGSSAGSADSSSTGSVEDLATGDTITVVATTSGDTTTATRLSEVAAQ